MRNSRFGGVLVGVALVSLLLAPAPALAYEFSRVLREGDQGRDVRALQVRLAGWYPVDDQRLFVIQGSFRRKTTRALKAFQRSYGLTVDGIAGPEVFAKLDRLQDGDGSTRHFDWSEFKQNHNEACTAEANAYAGTFKGGAVSPSRARRNVRWLMWRLEALRRKSGRHPVGINSGFRSVPYNDCIGGARASQHMYGTAADNRVAEIDNRTARDVARSSQVHGIGCYRHLTHNHFDLRIHNAALPGSQAWWWPDQDDKGRDLDSNGSPCWGETTTGSKGSGPVVPKLVRRGLAELGDLVPTVADLLEFEREGEPTDLHGED